MSARALLWVANLRGVSLAERGILQKLANHAHKDGTSARPSVQTIAAWAEMQPRTVRRILALLLARNLISVDSANARRGGRNRASVYTIIIPDDYDPRTWRETQAHPAPSEPKGGHFRHVAADTPNVERRTFSTKNAPVKADIFDTKRRTLESAQPVREPVPVRENRGVLTHAAREKDDDETKTDFEVLTEEATPLLIQSGCAPDQVEPLLTGLVSRCGDAYKAADQLRASVGIEPGKRLEWLRERTVQAPTTPDISPKAGERKAVRLMLRIRPQMSAYDAQCDLHRLLPKYGNRWAMLLARLTECSQLHPPPADLFVWLVSAAPAAHPGSQAVQ